MLHGREDKLPFTFDMLYIEMVEQIVNSGV